MNLKIQWVKNSSNPNDEYVVLKATAATNLKYYAVVDRTFDADGTVSNEHRHIYFFPARKLAKDEWIVLFSGTGTNGSDVFTDKTPCYTYYWQSGSCIWNNKGGDTASLIMYNAGNAVTVSPVPAKK